MTSALTFQMQRAMPVFETADMARSLAFYKSRLGFDAATWGEPPTFAIVQRGAVTVALAAVDDRPPAVSRKTWAAYVYVADIDALYHELRATGVDLPHPPVDRPYNCREFVLDDPDGHMLAFGSVLAPDPRGPGLSDRIGRDAGTGETP